MRTGIRLRTDQATYREWLRLMPGTALPAELMLLDEASPGDVPDQAGRFVAVDRLGSGERSEPAELPDRTVPIIPPMVAASLALHGCAELAVTVRLWAPQGGSFACFAIAGDLSASVRLAGDEVEIGLFQLSAVVDEVIRLVPTEPPPIARHLAAENVGVQITALSADSAAAGWRRTLIGTAAGWRHGQQHAGPHPPQPATDLRQELAADLRFALIDCLEARFPAECCGDLDG